MTKLTNPSVERIPDHIFCPIDGSRVEPWDADDPETLGGFGICPDCTSIWWMTLEGEDEVFGSMLLRQTGYQADAEDAIRAVEQLGVDLDWCSLCGRHIEAGEEHGEHELGGPLTPGPMRDAA